MRNGSDDRSFSITAQLSKRFSNGTELSGAYTYTDAKDRVSMGRDVARPQRHARAVDGSLEHRELRTSFWERPHKVTLVATTDLPLGFRLGLTYFGISGGAYTYVALGDPNADGFRPFGDLSNDIVYVPKDAADISLADRADYRGARQPDSGASLVFGISEAVSWSGTAAAIRGSTRQRPVCRSGFVLADRRTFEVTADLFNVLSFLDSDWGRIRQTPTEDAGSVPLLDLVGYDVPNGRGVYEQVGVTPREIDVEASRWRLELGVTLSF